jgi:hypothetical protein
MVFSRKATFQWTLVFFFVCLLCDAVVFAKKNTEDPTARPTFAPTASPSSNPTISISPSSKPSRSPSFFPTATSTISPSTKPTTSAPKLLGVLRQTKSPKLIFDVILSDENFSIQKIQSFFVDFLDHILEKTSTTYSFDYSHMDFNGSISTSNETQLLGSEYIVTMDGPVYYFNEAPTTQSLTQSLNVYFSFWGPSDLQQFLTDVGFEAAVVISISIGGEKISILSNLVEKESQGAKRNFFYTDGGDLAKATIVMMYTGIFFIIVIVALIVVRHRIGRRRLKQETESQSYDVQSTKKSNDSTDEEMRVLSKALVKFLRGKELGINNAVSPLDAYATEDPPMMKTKKKFKDSDVDVEDGEGKKEEKMGFFSNLKTKIRRGKESGINTAVSTLDLDASKDPPEFTTKETAKDSEDYVDVDIDNDVDVDEPPYTENPLQSPTMGEF